MTEWWFWFHPFHFSATLFDTFDQKAAATWLQHAWTMATHQTLNSWRFTTNIFSTNHVSHLHFHVVGFAQKSVWNWETGNLKKEQRNPNAAPTSFLPGLGMHGGPASRELCPLAAATPRLQEGSGARATGAPWLWEIDFNESDPKNQRWRITKWMQMVGFRMAAPQ